VQGNGFYGFLQKNRTSFHLNVRENASKAPTVIAGIKVLALHPI
jgi:hypothetical protein